MFSYIFTKIHWLTKPTLLICKIAGYLWTTCNTCDLSIASTKTKFMKLNTKTQNLNENFMTTFLYTLTGVTRKQKEKKVFFFKVYTKVECY